MSLDERESVKFADEAKHFFKQREEASKQIRDHGVEYVAISVSMLKHRNPFYQRQAIRELGEIGPPARDAVPELKKLLRERRTRRTRVAAARRSRKLT